MELKIEYIYLVTGECFKVYEMMHQDKNYYRVLGEFGETIQINKIHVTWIQYERQDK